MSNTLIDMELLARRVEEHLGKINFHHVSYPEVIKLLLDEMDVMREQYDQHLRSLR